MVVLMLPAGLSAQQWGRGVVPGDSVKATTATVVVYGRFAQWSDSTISLADTTLARETMRGLQVWQKRDAGMTFAKHFAVSAVAALALYAVDDNRQGREGLYMLLGVGLTLGGFGFEMLTKPGKWVRPR